jgi:hypothetical protein
MTEAVRVRVETTDERRVSVAYSSTSNGTTLYVHVRALRGNVNGMMGPWSEPSWKADWLPEKESEWPALRAAVDRAFTEYHGRFDPRESPPRFTIVKEPLP